MIAFLIQLAILVLLSILLGYFLGWIAKKCLSVSHIQSLDHEYKTLSQEADQMLKSLEDCYSRVQLQTQSAGDISKPASPANEAIEPRVVEPDPADDSSVTESLSSSMKSSPDDLKRIKGIGTKLEMVLNDLGIYYFSQIAELTPEKEHWIDDQLQFKGRIKRDKWIEQARDLTSNS